MSFTRLLSLVPSRRDILTVFFSSLAGGFIAWAFVPGRPASIPGPPHDARFVGLGKAYLPQLGKAYAAAWDEGAKQLEAGKGVSAALDVVSQTWSSNRTELYDHVFTPEFSQIVAESVNDTDVTPRERAALAAAWRGLSLGLGK